MLTHYFEIKAIPQAEILRSEVLSFILQQLHHNLPAFAGRIGIAFPEYISQRTLGTVIRVMSNEIDLRKLHGVLIHKEAGLQDYALFNEEVIPIPIRQVRSHYCFARQHLKGKSYLRRHEKFLQNKGLPAEEIKQRMEVRAAKQAEMSALHVQLKSRSTGQNMFLNIMRVAKKQPQLGTFSSYGLSRTATVPNF